MLRKRMKTSFVWFCMILVCFIILWPVYWIVKSSFTQSEELYTMPIQYLPIHLSIESYKTLFSSTDFSKYIGHTLGITSVTLILSVFLCALAAYGFARTNTKAMSIAFAFLLLSTMVPATVTVLPLMRMWRLLHLTDTFSGITLLYFSMVIPFSTIMYSGFIRQIPPSLEEAAMIDGMSSSGAFFKVIFPLLKPVAATLCIINFIACINEFFTPLMFTARKIKVISMIMSNIPRVNQYQLPWDTISAAGCLMLLPILLMVVLFEKNIMDGLMMGSIKQ